MLFKGQAILKNNVRLHRSQSRLGSVMQQCSTSISTDAPKLQAPKITHNHVNSEYLNLFYLRGMTPHDSREELKRSIKLMYRKKPMTAEGEMRKNREGGMTAMDYHEKLMQKRFEKMKDSRQSLLKMMVNHVLENPSMIQSTRMSTIQNK